MSSGKSSEKKIGGIIVLLILLAALIGFLYLNMKTGEGVLTTAGKAFGDYIPFAAGKSAVSGLTSGSASGIAEGAGEVALAAL